MPNKKYIDVIKRLRRNSRESLTNISKAIDAPLSTVHDRVKAVSGKYVKKHTSIVDFEKLGYLLKAKILLRTTEKEKIGKFISSHKNINSAFALSGNHDFLIEGVFRDEEELDVFNNELDMLPITSKELYIVNEDLKREEFLCE
jgi:Lrp/AsnC family transcriptional regulator, leucine-responsive regulatory protein